MTKKFLFILGLVVLLSANFCFAQGSDGLRVEEIKICTQVEDRVPMGADNIFTNDVRKLHCFTKVVGAYFPTMISHVWYYNGQKMAEVDLDVGADSWRTWSSKNISDYWIGDWRVEIVNSDGDILDSIDFVVESD